MADLAGLDRRLTRQWLLARCVQEAGEFGGLAEVVLRLAADEGWQAQSADHRDALRALGIRHGIVELTRADRANQQRRAEVTAQVRAELAGTALADALLTHLAAWAAGAAEADAIARAA